MGGRPFSIEDSAFPCTLAVPNPPSGAVLWSTQEHSQLGRESPFPGPPSPLFRLQGNHQAFSQSSQRWQPHRSPLRPPGSVHDRISIKVKNSQNQWGFKKRCDNKRKRYFVCLFVCFFPWQNTRNITGKVTLQTLRSQFVAFRSFKAKCTPKMWSN